MFDFNALFNTYKWKKVTCTFNTKTFENVEFPDFWSDDSIGLVTEKFFRVVKGERETSLKQVVNRIAGIITMWGSEQFYFTSKVEEDDFAISLAKIIIEQKAAFNSPVWFNLGVSEDPQTSACYILDIEDTLEGILDTIKLEGMIFKGGSGSGINLSPLRSSYETLSGGGYSSGPVSFMQPLDAGCGATKSGGTTRRAAAMRILNINHPDILELKNGSPGFINCKVEEDLKCKFLIQNGFSSNLDTGVYSRAQYQNANNSVSITDDFMRAVENDENWNTVTQKGKTVHTYKARDLMDKICEATWHCGDPGIQFYDTINRFNPHPTIPITASNPCSEFLFIPFTSCNLASIRLMAFLNIKTKEFDIRQFSNTVTTMITAQDIIINKSFFPDKRFKDNSMRYRSLGLGYCDLGSLFVNLEHRYGSKESLAITELITSYMTFKAFEISSIMADRIGGLEKEVNDKVKEILKKQTSICTTFLSSGFTCNLSNAHTIAEELGKIIETLSTKELFRNCQVSLAAPTGTISFAMGAESTGIECIYSPEVYKSLVGGGSLKMVSPSIERFLKSKGWDGKSDFNKFIDSMSKENQDVIRTAAGKYQLTWEDHVNIVAAAQKYLSGAVSKTVNIPNNATVEDIKNIYFSAWKKGIKAVAIYRDGSKAVQVLKTDDKPSEPKKVLEIRGTQRKLPTTINSVRHGFRIGNHKGWLHIGMYPNGDIGEIWIRMDGFGDTINGLTDCLCKAISYGLQYGVPVEKYLSAFWHIGFKPQGFTSDDKVKNAPSIPSYVVRKIADMKFSKEYLIELGIIQGEQEEKDITNAKFTGELCPTCGTELLITGRCKFCPSCRISTGGCE